MKLPDKDDPGGNKESALPLSIVLSTLSQNGVTIKPFETGKHYILIKDTEIQAQAFDDLEAAS